MFMGFYKISLLLAFMTIQYFLNVSASSTEGSECLLSVFL